MRNKYPGICYRCGKYVKVGEGHFERVKGATEWRVQHASCAIRHRAIKGVNEKEKDIFKQEVNNEGL